MTNDHQKNIEECKNVFVSWQWGITAIIGTIIVLVGLVYSYTSKQDVQDNKINNNTNSIISIKTDVSSLKYMKQDMDSIKTWTRHK
jgi:hypothetical protein